ncbi:MAG: isoamylase early set domain-containing protein [Planctomycetota bacterium]|jgi:5'-AMP-activated protein kinase regulatory beta subunit
MFAKGRKKGTVRFSVRPPSGEKKVELAGDFNGWRPARMRRQKDGNYVCLVSLRPGTYEYKFVLGGQWSVDGDNGNYALNPYGTLNSVATVT